MRRPPIGVETIVSPTKQSPPSPVADVLIEVISRSPPTLFVKRWAVFWSDVNRKRSPQKY